MAAVRIKHVAWREGRPRFSPGPELRANGHKGKDLRHDDGTWFTLDEAQRWSVDLQQSLIRPKVRKSVDRLASRDAAATSDRAGYVYFLWAGRRMKIGFSTDPLVRGKSLQTSISDPIRLFLAVPGTPNDERRLHRRLKSQRVTGEWFVASVFTLRVMRMVLNDVDAIYKPPALEVVRE